MLNDPSRSVMPMPPRHLLLALALVSAAALAYEILLTRLFSIIAWHHFAYMMISVALLGYGAAGTVVTCLRDRLDARFETTFALAAASFGVTAIGAFLIAQRVPFNALEFLWDMHQPLWLGAIYLLLFVPFFFAAVCVCLMFSRFAAAVQGIYSCDILGAAAGSIGIVAALFTLRPLGALALVGALGILAALIATSAPRLRAAFAFLLVALAGWQMIAPPALRVSQYKELSQTLEVMGTHVVAEHSSPLGHVTVVASPQVPLRFAPGMSLAAPLEPPEQLAVFTDGEGMNAIQKRLGDPAQAAYLDYLTSAASYAVLDRPRVLILGAGTGADVLQARAHRARDITAVELNPAVVDLVDKTFGDFSGRPYSKPDVHVHIGEARGFIARTDQRFDLVQLALLDAFGASSAGLYALSESYLYTVEALQAYMSRLRPDGLLSITRWVTLPPRDTLKLVGMAQRALAADGVPHPERRLVIIRGWRTATMLLKNGDFTAADIAALKRFCKERSFDLDWYAGMPASEANRYNQLDQSWFYDGVHALFGPGRDAYIAQYKFDIEPATDDRPYFFHFFRWQSLIELLSMRKEGGLPLLEWGYPLVVATLLQALAASAVLIGLPLWWLRRRGGADALPDGAPWLRTAGYFGAVGMAFMFVEMAFIQKFTLFLSHPLYAVAVVLFSFLLAAGCGSHMSGRLPVVRALRGTPAALPVLAIAALALLYGVALPQMLPDIADWSDAARIAVAVALIFPLGFAMGMPFPIGLAGLAARHAPLVPWAWGVNACASVVSAVLATLLAIHLGFDAVLVLAVALYLVAAFVCGRAPADQAVPVPAVIAPAALATASDADESDEGDYVSDNA